LFASVSPHASRKFSANHPRQLIGRVEQHLPSILPKTPTLSEDLGWRPIITSWLERRVAAAAASGAAAAAVQEARDLAGVVGKLVERYMEAALEFKRLNCRCVTPHGEPGFPPRC
jgi:hypothetical protein